MLIFKPELAIYNKKAHTTQQGMWRGSRVSPDIHGGGAQRARLATEPTAIAHLLDVESKGRACSA